MIRNSQKKIFEKILKNGRVINFLCSKFNSEIIAFKVKNGVLVKILNIFTPNMCSIFIFLYSIPPYQLKTTFRIGFMPVSVKLLPILVFGSKV